VIPLRSRPHSGSRDRLVSRVMLWQSFLDDRRSLEILHVGLLIASAPKPVRAKRELAGRCARCWCTGLSF
jgi:hypothetical protein